MRLRFTQIKSRFANLLLDKDGDALNDYDLIAGMPIVVFANETFTVHDNRRILWAGDITIEGHFTVNGDFYDAGMGLGFHTL